MTYKILSLKWRPQSFADIIGQDHVTETLTNAFKKDRVSQGYMLTGPRGVGKTTTARIIAKALNCPKTKNALPCNECTTCIEITDGRNLDVLEIDGASNRGIDEIRNIREQIRYSPMNSPYKIFVIDEVHMLTSQAFNALLRTLEEPPAHGKFIMATTDIHKVPSTIISRCQRFDFNRINEENISNRLSLILKDEQIESDNESLQAIAKKADGSMRDALSIMDQVIAFSGNKIFIDEISSIIGLIPIDIYFDYSDSIKNKDSIKMLTVLKTLRSASLPITEVTNGLSQHFRNYIIASVPNGGDLLSLNEEHKDRYISSANEWNKKDFLRIIKVLNDLEYSLKHASQPMISFEMTAFKLLEMDSSVSISEILQKNPLDINIIDKTTPLANKETNLKVPVQNNTKIKPSEKSFITKNANAIKNLNINKDYSLDKKPLLKNDELEIKKNNLNLDK